MKNANAEASEIVREEMWRVHDKINNNRLAQCSSPGDGLLLVDFSDYSCLGNPLTLHSHLSQWCLPGCHLASYFVPPVVALFHHLKSSTFYSRW